MPRQYVVSVLSIYLRAGVFACQAMAVIKNKEDALSILAIILRLLAEESKVGKTQGDQHHTADYHSAASKRDIPCQLMSWSCILIDTKIYNK